MHVCQGTINRTSMQWVPLLNHEVILEKYLGKWVYHLKVALHIPSIFRTLFWNRKWRKILLCNFTHRIHKMLRCWLSVAKESVEKNGIVSNATGWFSWSSERNGESVGWRRMLLIQWGSSDCAAVSLAWLTPWHQYWSLVEVPTGLFRQEIEIMCWFN